MCNHDVSYVPGAVWRLCVNQQKWKGKKMRQWKMKQTIDKTYNHSYTREPVYSRPRPNRWKGNRLSEYCILFQVRALYPISELYHRLKNKVHRWPREGTTGWWLLSSVSSFLLKFISLSNALLFDGFGYLLTFNAILFIMKIDFLIKINLDHI